MNSVRCAIVFIIVSAIFTLPFLLNPYLPLVDIPNHIARLYIAAHPDSSLNLHYTYSINLTPNLALDVVWLIIGRGFDAVKFTNAMVAVSLVNFVASVMLLSRVVLGKWTIWPAASALLVYNGPFYWGFVGYLFSIPFALYFLALWLALEKSTNWLRIGIFIPLCLMLYFMHLFAFVLLAVAVLGREIQRVVEAGSGWKRVFANNIALAIPYIIPSLLVTIQVFSNQADLRGSKTEFGPFAERLTALFSPFSGYSFTYRQYISPENVVAALALFLILYYFTRRSTRPCLSIASPFKGPIIAVFIMTIIMPDWIGGVAFLHIRFPFVLLGMLIAATQWHGVTTKLAATLAITILATLSFRVWGFNMKAAEFSKDVTQLAQAFKTLPKGSKIFSIMNANNYSENKVGFVDYWNIDGYGVLMAEAFVPDLFKGTHALSMSDHWNEYLGVMTVYNTDPSVFNVDIQNSRPDIVARYGFLNGWENEFTHVLLTNANHDDFIGSPTLERISERGRFMLFRVLPSDKDR